MPGTRGPEGASWWRQTLEDSPGASAWPLLSSPGTCPAGTMSVTFALLLLLSQATSDPCYHPGGRARFCLPPVTQLAGVAASCPQACTLSTGAEGSRAACNGSLTLALGGSFLLASVSLRFCSPGPPALVLSAAWAAGGPWRSLWRRPAWPGALGGPEKVTFRAPPGSKASVVASHLRVEFGGRAGLAAAGVRGRCQCHGHADRCAARARPPRCRCRHHTTGPGCESCRPSHRDWPWRPATPWHPHPCLRESWARSPQPHPHQAQGPLSVRDRMFSLPSCLLLASPLSVLAGGIPSSPPPTASHCLPASLLPIRGPLLSRPLHHNDNDNDNDTNTIFRAPFPDSFTVQPSPAMCQAGAAIRPILQMRRLRLELGNPLRKDTQPVSGRAGRWAGEVLACPCRAPVRRCHTQRSRAADRTRIPAPRG